MTPREQEIYNGLKSIGPEIAVFFQDAVAISKLDIETKPYLLSHLAREIESGLRDILAPSSSEEIKICDRCSRPLNRKIGHKESILNSLGIKEENDLVKKWYATAKEFPKYAHRHGAWKSPREKLVFDGHWNNFVDILEYLVGNYYAIADRLDIIVQNEPSSEIISTLPNLLKQESRFVYFFNKLDSPKWLVPLFEAGYFKGSSNPEPVESKGNPGLYSMPFWAVLRFLESVAEGNFQKNDPAISTLLLKIIEDISSYRRPDNLRIENHYTDYTLFKIIRSLPKGSLTVKHLMLIEELIKSNKHNLIGHDFDELVKRIIQEGDSELIKEIIRIMFSYRIVTDYYEKTESIFETYQLSIILTNIKEGLLAGFPELTYDCSLKIINDLIPLQGFSFNTYSIPAIENHEQTSFPDNLDCQLVYLLRDCLIVLPEKIARDKIKSLLDGKESIHVRLAIYSINKRFSEFSDLFFDWNANPLNFTEARHELYELLREHVADINGKQLDLVLTWIESAEYFVSEEDKTDPKKVEKISAYRKKEWLSALELSKDKRIPELVDKHNKVNSAEVSHPGHNSWHSGLIGNVSPLSIDEIVKMNLEEVIDYYETFSKQPQDFMGPSSGGLIDNLILTIRLNPESYSTSIGALRKANSELLHAWIRGLQEAWREEKKSFKVSNILAFVLELISDEKFWKAHNGNDGPTRWFISSLLSFLEDGLRDDGHAFDPDSLPQVKKILFTIHKNDHYTKSDYSDLAMAVVNNSKGKIYIAFLQYSLRLARVEGKESDRWDLDVKKVFDDAIKADKKEDLMFHVMGQFLPNIEYLDYLWVKENFNGIFPLKDDAIWTASLSGYFFYHPQVSKDRFELFRSNGHFHHALENKFQSLNSGIKKAVIQNLCSAYFNALPNAEIDSALVTELLANKNEGIYSHIIFFFGHVKLPRGKAFSDRVKLIWKTIYNDSIKLENPVFDSYVLSGCSMWLRNLNEIDDDVFSMLISSAPHVTLRDRYYVIEALERLIETTPVKVGQILLAIYKREITYDVSRGKLVSMVRYLYNAGAKEEANNICILHAEHGYHFLRELFQEFN